MSKKNTAILCIPGYDYKDEIQLDDKIKISLLKEQIYQNFPQSTNHEIHFILNGTVLNENTKVIDLFEDFGTNIITIYVSILFPLKIIIFPPTDQTENNANQKSYGYEILLRDNDNALLIDEIVNRREKRKNFRISLSKIKSGNKKEPLEFQTTLINVAEMFDPNDEIGVDFIEIPIQEELESTPWKDFSIPYNNNDLLMQVVSTTDCDPEIAKVALLISARLDRAIDLVLNGQAETLLRNSFDLSKPLLHRDPVEISLILLRHPDLAYQYLKELSQENDQDVFLLARSFFSHLKLLNYNEIDFEMIFIKAVHDGFIVNPGEYHKLIDFSTLRYDDYRLFQLLCKINDNDPSLDVFNHLEDIISQYFPFILQGHSILHMRMRRIRSLAIENGYRINSESENENESLTRFIGHNRLSSLFNDSSNSPSIADEYYEEDHEEEEERVDIAFSSSRSVEDDFLASIQENKADYNNNFEIFIENIIQRDDDTQNLFAEPETLTDLLEFDPSFNNVIINLEHMYHIHEIPKDKLQQLATSGDGFIDALIQYRLENPVNSSQ